MITRQMLMDELYKKVFGDRTTHIRIKTINVQSDRRVEDKTAKNAVPGFDGTNFESRWPLLKEFLASRTMGFSNPAQDPTIFMLQEMDDAAKEKLQEYFESQGMIFLSEKYTGDASDKSAFSFGMALPQQYSVVNTRQVYFTQTGKPLTREEQDELNPEQRKVFNCGSEFAKSAQLVTLRDKKTGLEFLVVNMHPGLTNEHKLEVMRRIGVELQNEKRPIVLAGDMNAFDFDVPEPTNLEEMSETMMQNGFDANAKHLETEGVQSTFMSMPYDIFRYLDEAEKDEYHRLRKGVDPIEFRTWVLNIIKAKQIPLSGAVLDRVFTRGFASGADIRVNSATMTSEGLVYPNQKPDRAMFEDYVLDGYITGQGSVVMSDHYALLCHIMLEITWQQAMRFKAGNLKSDAVDTAGAVKTSMLSMFSSMRNSVTATCSRSPDSGEEQANAPSAPTLVAV